MAKKQKLFETDEFKRLQKEWYFKLYNSGFVDDESKPVRDKKTKKIVGVKVNNSEEIQPHVVNLNVYNHMTGHDYHAFCNEILRSFRFRNDVDRYIFEMHSNGLSDREVVKLVLSVFDQNIQQSTVNRIVTRIKQKYSLGETK